MYILFCHLLFLSVTFFFFFNLFPCHFGYSVSFNCLVSFSFLISGLCHPERLKGGWACWSDRRRSVYWKKKRLGITWELFFLQQSTSPRRGTSYYTWYTRFYMVLSRILWQCTVKGHTAHANINVQTVYFKQHKSPFMLYYPQLRVSCDKGRNATDAVLVR